MKIILTTLNSKYTHTSLALRYIGNWLTANGYENEWVEHTINTPLYQILGDLYRHQPDVILFSVYIWNGDASRTLAAELKKLMPHIKIVFGGPEVSFDSLEELKNNPDIDFIIRGEGEAVVENLMQALQNHSGDEVFRSINGLTWRDNGKPVMNPDQNNLDMDCLVFPYPDLDQLSNRILYYESSRGCPYNCSYCLSSATKGVRFRSTDKVQADLKQFLDAQVMQVKFIDRTFNANPDRALGLWKFLSDNDQGKTNFHFEITAELLRPQDIAFLETVRPGLFQFEVGIQTTLKEAREAVNRRLAFDQIKAPVQAILDAKNLHVHLDLIAGLPYETFERFLQSFDEVYALKPQVLQLGFLKLIKGSGLRAQEFAHGFIYESHQPYEVLQNKYIQFSEMLQLKDLEICLEQLHNSKRFIHTLTVVLERYLHPSEFFLDFSRWLRENGTLNEAVRAEKWYELVLQYAAFKALDVHHMERMRIALVADYMSAMGKQAPQWLSGCDSTLIKSDIFELVKQRAFIDEMPWLEAIAPKERVKHIRYTDMSQYASILALNLPGVKKINLETKTSQNAILIVELSEKHPVTERYATYLFV